MSELDDYVSRLETLRNYVRLNGEFLPNGQFSIAVDSTKLAELLRLACRDTPSPHGRSA